MKSVALYIILLFTSVMAHSQTKIFITANGQTRQATLSDTRAAEELRQLLEKGDIRVSMEDYGGFEKVGDLPQSLPTDNRQITTTAGDIMLYQGRSIVIFYGSNSWSYTPLGKIDNATASEIRSFLSGESIEITLSLNSAGIADVEADTQHPERIFDLAGRPIELADRPLSSLPKGVYLINGKKLLIN